MDPEPYDVLAVELSSFQLHYTDSMSAESAAVLNVAEDHLDWYAGPTRWPTTPPTRAGSTSGVQRACVYNVADPETERLVREADVVGGRPGDRLHPRHARASAWSASSRTSSPTGRSSRSGRPAPPSCARSPTSPRPAPHFVANALAAAALARAHGVPPAAVRDGLRALPPRRPPDRRRSPTSTGSPGSTTPRPPTRTPRSPRCRPTTRSCGSPAGWPRARRFDDLVAAVRDRLRGVVLLGRDRAVIADALARHAPDVPGHRRRRPARLRDGPMDRVVGGGRARWPSPATPCCWPRAAPPWTCSPTTAHAATPSPRRCTGCGGTEQDRQEDRDGEEDRRERHGRRADRQARSAAPARRLVADRVARTRSTGR